MAGLGTRPCPHTSSSSGVRAARPRARPHLLCRSGAGGPGGSCWPAPRAGARRQPLPPAPPSFPPASASNPAQHRGCSVAAAAGARPGRPTVTDEPPAATNGGEAAAAAEPGVLDNSSLTSMDWRDWVTTADEAAATNGGSGSILRTEPYDSDSESSDSDSGGGGAAGAAAAAAAAGMPLAPSLSACAPPMRVAFFCVAASFDRHLLEARLRESYGSPAVRKYPDVIHCQLEAGCQGQPGSDAFFFDYGVVAIWGLGAEAERQLVREMALPCAVQPLPEQDQEQDLFRCNYTTDPLAAGAVAAVPLAVVAEAAANGALSDSEAGGSGGSMAGGTTSGRRMMRRAAATAAAAAAAMPPPAPAVVLPSLEMAAAAGGALPVLPFAPVIADDTITLHMRDCGDTAPKLAASYALAQSTRLSAYEKAVTAIVTETKHLPETLAEFGEVDIPSKEIGKLIGRVFVLKRSVNLLGSVNGTPEFFWYAPDQLQTLYGRLTEYVELESRVELLNSRFAVLQEMLELLRAQEENRHGSRLELIVIWLIVVEVALGFLELLDLLGFIGPPHNF